MKWLLILFLFAAWANSVRADCWYNGRIYPEGTVIGPYVCSGGQWVTR